MKTRTLADLSTAEILRILQQGAWTCENQSITSAETNTDDNPEPLEDSDENACGVDAYTDITFPQGTRTILDVGGGKFDCCRDFMRRQNIELKVWDPYNRSDEHNRQVLQDVRENKVDVATSMAVLNVIMEVEVRLAHIATLKDALPVNGLAYFKIWPGMRDYLPRINPYNLPGFQANAGPDYFIKEVQIVFGLNYAEIHPTIPNLIIAKKASDEATADECIRQIRNGV